MVVDSHPGMAAFLSPPAGAGSADAGNAVQHAETAADEASQKGSDGPKPVQTFGRALGRLRQPEQFLFPAAGDDWVGRIGWIGRLSGLSNRR